MSIQVRERKKGKVYVVHYYDGDKRKYVNRTFFDPGKTDKQNEKDAQAAEYANALLAHELGNATSRPRYVAASSSEDAPESEQAPTPTPLSPWLDETP